MAFTPAPRLIVTEHRPYRHVLKAVAVVLAFVLIVTAYWLGGRRAAPEAATLRQQWRALQLDHTKAVQRLDKLTQKVATLERSEQVERDAARALQDTLAERDAELAGLRNDVAFYERLAGGDSQRQPLSVHSLDLESLGDGSWRYTLTLTQNLKRAATSKGQYRLRVEGSIEGRLQTLDWDALLEHKDAAPGQFSFKYFQQIEGSFMLPAGFVPHRVRVSLHSDQGQIEQVVPWNAPNPKE
ncbi:MAG: hypothetical protein KDI69_09865 [Xanthomonadales bacterium]|nr:hypothetical protein [Xanthomonadales bacterium]